LQYSRYFFIASKLNNFTRTPSCKISGSWSPTWSSSVINPSCPNIRSIHNQWQLIHNQQRCALESNLKFPVSKNNPSSTLSIEAQGQWLLSLNACGDGLISNHFNTSSDIHATPPSLNSNGQFYSPMNSNNKKPNPHIARFGITVCGSK
uniref:Ricin B-type lectin domain-containing protein n=1 Tax=Schistosoma curassoni TaxID=6186 RepID=A0A183L3Y2_9TREM